MISGVNLLILFSEIINFLSAINWSNAYNAPNPDQLFLFFWLDLHKNNCV